MNETHERKTPFGLFWRASAVALALSAGACLVWRSHEAANPDPKTVPDTSKDRAYLPSSKSLAIEAPTVDGQAPGSEGSPVVPVDDTKTPPTFVFGSKSAAPTGSGGLFCSDGSRGAGKPPTYLPTSKSAMPQDFFRVDQEEEKRARAQARPRKAPPSPGQSR